MNKQELKLPAKLYWNTVSPLLKAVLIDFMRCSLFDTFRLVGGTSLSLQLGHRMSIDIDLFTDAPYGSLDFKQIEEYLKDRFLYCNRAGSGEFGIGTTYFVGNSEQDAVKLDIYYTDEFIQGPLVIEGIRMATSEEIIAMKMDIVQRGGRKKDFWDLHELMTYYSIDEMIVLHEQRYPFDHDDQLIKMKFIDFEKANNDFDPVCLKDKTWEGIQLDILTSGDYDFLFLD